MQSEDRTIRWPSTRRNEIETAMLYLKLAYDRPGTAATRDSVREAHRAYLRQGPVRLVQAGPFCVSDTDDTNLGSFMILDAPDRAAVQRFHDNDPFTKAGVYGEVHIHRWDKHVG
jgi:uncharacterized protein